MSRATEVRDRFSMGPAGGFRRVDVTTDTSKLLDLVLEANRRWVETENEHRTKVYAANAKARASLPSASLNRSSSKWMHALRIPIQDVVKYTAILGPGFWNDPDLVRHHPEWHVAKL